MMKLAALWSLSSLNEGYGEHDTYRGSQWHADVGLLPKIFQLFESGRQFGEAYMACNGRAQSDLIARRSFLRSHNTVLKNAKCTQIRACTENTPSQGRQSEAAVDGPRAHLATGGKVANFAPPRPPLPSHPSSCPAIRLQQGQNTQSTLPSPQLPPLGLLAKF